MRGATGNSKRSKGSQKKFPAVISKKLVPVKLAQIYNLANKYVGEGKPDAPVYWAERGRVEIIPIADIKKFYWYTTTIELGGSD